jgi:hypothetical protein
VRVRPERCAVSASAVCHLFRGATASDPCGACQRARRLGGVAGLFDSAASQDVAGSAANQEDSEAYGAGLQENYSR